MASAGRDRVTRIRSPLRRPSRRMARTDGPLLVEGPVEVVLEDGTVVRSDRFAVALCVCRRSRCYPWCDTSHRARERRKQRADEPPSDRNPE